MTLSKTEKLGWNVEADLKKSFQNMVEHKYDGKKRNFCKKEVEKAMKLYLTLHGDDSYMNDSSVNEMLNLFEERFNCTHTQNVPDENLNTKNDKSMKYDIRKKIHREQVNYKDNREMEHFAESFKETFKDRVQVSRQDLDSLIIKNHGVYDKRSIQNRVNYLVVSGCIESYAPNVYNVKI